MQNTCRKEKKILTYLSLFLIRMAFCLLFRMRTEEEEEGAEKETCIVFTLCLFLS